jgi:hypothetical protein
MDRTTINNIGGQRVYICVGQHAWGKGKTPEEAKRNCRHEGGKEAMEAFTVYSLPESVEWDISEVDGTLAVAIKGVTEIIERKRAKA